MPKTDGGAKDCEKAWIHTGWEDTMQKIVRMAGAPEEEISEKMEEMHERKVEKMIKSAEGSAGFLHKITQPTMWRESTDLGERGRREIAGAL